MPILENVKLAEEQAEKLREDARNEVELLLIDTKNKANEEALKKISEAKAKAKELEEKCLDEMNTLAEKNEKRINEAKEKLSNLAKLNFEVGVNYILKRVVER